MAGKDRKTKKILSIIGIIIGLLVLIFLVYLIIKGFGQIVVLIGELIGELNSKEQTLLFVGIIIGLIGLISLPILRRYLKKRKKLKIKDSSLDEKLEIDESEISGKSDKDEKALRQELKNYLNAINEAPENVDALKASINILEKLGEKEKARELNDQLEKITEKKEFELNLSKRIKLHRLELRDLYFFDNFEWSFQPQVNVLLGRNGFGKSYLMRLLAALLQKNDERSAEFFKNSRKKPSASLTVERDNEEETILRRRIMFEESIGKVPVLGIPDLRMVDKSKSGISASDDEKADLRHHGAYHFLYQKSYEGLIRNFLYQLCITHLDQGKRFDLPIFKFIHRVIGELTNNKFEFSKIEPVGRAQFLIEVFTEGNEKHLPLQQASQGTLSVLAVFGLIYEYLKAVFPKVPEKKLTHQPAIVFIDELDAHLHPAWQQKIIGLLRENFPNVQFLLTAHSPLVVAGCKAGEVAVLRKQENGFGVHVFEHDFIGYETKELYEKVFEIEENDETYLKHIAMSPFKEEIEEKINELEEKQKKKPLSEKDKTELDQLYDEIYYIGKAEDKYQQRMEYSRLRIENRNLKAKLKKLEREKKRERS